MPARKPKAKKSRKAKSAVQIEVPAVGQRWPGSRDIYIGECLGENGAPNHRLLLVCDKRGKPFVLDKQVWGEIGQAVKGADSHRNGLANTEAMLGAGNSLAKTVRAHGADCYLPAICELQMIRANCPVKLPEDWFWSSTQYSADNAWGQHFGSGYTDSWFKDYRDRAFVVRRVLIQ